MNNRAERAHFAELLEMIESMFNIDRDNLTLTKVKESYALWAGSEIYYFTYYPLQGWIYETEEIWDEDFLFVSDFFTASI